MRVHLVVSVMFLFAEQNLSETVSIRPPDLIKKNIGENCRLQWTVSGTFSSYTISLLVNGNPSSLGLNKETAYDSVKGIITLTILNIQLQDAGNYVLTLKTGSQPEPNSIGTLFVYGPSSSSVNNPSGKTQFTEGEIIELNCTATSLSAPQTSQTKFYYFWQIYSYGNLQNTSTDPALTINGDLAIGYSLKNGGQTIVIDTARILYPIGNARCQVQEEGSFYISDFNYLIGLTLNHRPFAYYYTQPSKKYNLISTGGSTTFQFYFYSVPSLSSFSNCTFVNISGNAQVLPLQTNISAVTYTYVFIPLSIPGSYGNYTFTLSNSMGSTDVILQILPPDVPDAPNDFKVRFVTHSVVSLQWRCGWYNGGPQTVTVQLRNVATGTVVETLSTSLTLNTYCYNSLYSTTFQTNIDLNTEYEGSIWSTNTYGQSNITTLRVTTSTKPTFTITCNDISIIDSRAIVKVTTSLVGVWLRANSCVEATAQCVTQYVTLLSTENQIQLNDLPKGDEYVFDFVLFNRTSSYIYTLAFVKGIRKSRTSDCFICNATEENKSLLIAVIVLAVLLGVAILALIICLVLILRSRHHSPATQFSSQQQATGTLSTNIVAAHRESEMNPSDNYEAIIRNDDDGHYTSLDDQPPQKSPQIPMKRF